MSYKCAVFGHKYGEAEVDRERTEEGNEVIITVRETETCKRCDDTRVVSENKEVTTMETAADIVADDLEEDADPNPAQANQSAPSDQAEQTQSQPPAETIEEAESQPTPTETHSDAVDPETDDGIILDDDDDEDEDEKREEGEWPGETGNDEDSDAVPDDGDEPAPQQEEGSGWPDEGTDREQKDAGLELPSDIDTHPETESSAGKNNGTLTIPEGTFYCPECEFTTPVESSSLRAGDFCPECHKGTLEHNRDD